MWPVKKGFIPIQSCAYADVYVFAYTLNAHFLNTTVLFSALKRVAIDKEVKIIL